MSLPISLSFISITLLLLSSLTIFAAEIPELPEVASASVGKAKKNFNKALDQSYVDLGKDIAKQKAKFIKAYKKLEKSLINKGQVKGMKIVVKRIEQLQHEGGKSLFGGSQELDAIELAVLPEAAQELELEYQNDISALMNEQSDDAFSAQEKFVGVLRQECKRLAKKRQFDDAEIIEAYIEKLTVIETTDKISAIVSKAACLSDPAAMVSSAGDWDGKEIPRDGLVFVWEHAKAANRIVSKKGRVLAQCTVIPRAKSQINKQGYMEFEAGAFLADAFNAPLLHLCKQSNQLTIEAVINPAHSEHVGPARIISFSLDGSKRNFSLCQEGSHLSLRLRTPQTGDNGTNPDVGLGSIPHGKESHVLISYQDGQLDWWLNGQHHQSKNISGDFSNWDEHQHLVFGDDYNDARLWAGTLRSVRIYARATAAEQAQSAFKSAR